MDYEIPETKPCTRLLLYLSLASFVCGFSLLNPSVAYAGEEDENSVCANSGRHKGRFASKRRLSVLKNLYFIENKITICKQMTTEVTEILFFFGFKVVFTFFQIRNNDFRQQKTKN